MKNQHTIFWIGVISGLMVAFLAVFGVLLFWPEIWQVLGITI